MRSLLIILFCFPFFVNAQSLPSIEDKTKSFKPFPGYLKFYWDQNAGKLWLEIDKLDTELLYLSSLPAGLGSNDIGLDRGMMGNSSIIKFSRVGNKIMMIEPNYAYRAVTNNVAEKRAVEQSFAPSTLWGFTVEAE